MGIQGLTDGLSFKSITELRGIAQAVGIKLDFGWDKQTLVGKISAKVNRTVDAPTVSDTPSDRRLRVVGPARNLSQRDIAKELDKYKERGLVYTFPTPDSVLLTVTRVKQDSCSLRVPLRVIKDCVRRLIND